MENIKISFFGVISSSTSFLMYFLAKNPPLDYLYLSIAVFFIFFIYENKTGMKPPIVIPEYKLYSALIAASWPLLILISFGVFNLNDSHWILFVFSIHLSTYINDMIKIHQKD